MSVTAEDLSRVQEILQARMEWESWESISPHCRSRSQVVQLLFKVPTPGIGQQGRCTEPFGLCGEGTLPAHLAEGSSRRQTIPILGTECLIDNDQLLRSISMY